MSRRCFFCLFMIVGLSGQLGVAQDTKVEKKDPPKPVVKAPPMNVVPPTHADVPYGKHERQVIDFYQAKSDTPTPLVFYIHGGGWQGGSKTGFNVKPFLEASISVAAINYRYVKNAVEEKVEPPVKAPLHDAAAHCSSCARRRKSGTSTKSASARRVVRRAAARHCGSRSMMTSPIRRATTRSLANRLACPAPR